MRSTLSIAGSGLLLCYALAAGPASTGARAAEQPPQWWSDRGVRTTNAANDCAALNMGQFKNLAFSAWLEMETLPGGAGFAPDFTNAANNYAAVTVGQLKVALRPFCDRLGLSGHYPWSGSAASNDDAIANIGQAKHLFGFDPRSGDFDQDGLPDQWEIANGLEPCRGEDAAADADGDRSSNLDEYQRQTDPQDRDTDDDGLGDWEDDLPKTPGPRITICSPAAGAVLSSPDVTVCGFVTSTGGLHTVRIDGERVNVYAQGNGVYAFTNVIGMDDGEHKISVRAIASLFPRLESRAVVTVSVDAQSSDITILRPVDLAAFNGANVHVTVRTESTNDVVTVNGGPTTRDGYIRYAWVTLKALGTNVICATSVDEHNRVSTDSVQVLCTDLTCTDPNDTDCDGVPDPLDPAPDNPSVRSRIRILSPLNGTPFRAK